MKSFARGLGIALGVVGLSVSAVRAEGPAPVPTPKLSPAEVTLVCGQYDKNKSYSRSFLDGARSRFSAFSGERASTEQTAKLDSVGQGLEKDCAGIAAAAPSLPILQGRLLELCVKRCSPQSFDGVCHQGCGFADAVLGGKIQGVDSRSKDLKECKSSLILTQSLLDERTAGVVGETTKKIREATPSDAKGTGSSGAGSSAGAAGGRKFTDIE